MEHKGGCIYEDLDYPKKKYMYWRAFLTYLAFLLMVLAVYVASKDGICLKSDNSGKHYPYGIRSVLVPS